MVSGFKKFIIETKDIRSPIKVVNGASFLFIRTGKLYAVAITNSNVQALLVFEILFKLVEIFEAYFKTIDEDTIRTNFSLIYELLDEILDYGYPQYCTKDILQAIITQGKMKYNKGKDPALSGKLTKQITGSVPWRSPDIKYRKNQVFIDVVETVNVIVSSNNNILSSDVAGKILINSELSGMPTCVLGLNDRCVFILGENKSSNTSRKGSGKIPIDSVNFHQCVNLDRFNSERKISFIPLDGSFELMKYRTTDSITLPFKIFHNIKESGDHIRFDITVKSCYNFSLTCEMAKVKIPVPKNTAVCKVSTSSGKAKYLPESNCILWKIARMSGAVSVTLTADVELIHTTTKTPWSKPPIVMDFEIPMFLPSDIKIVYMKVTEKASYESIKWVRYITKAGSYQYRI